MTELSPAQFTRRIRAYQDNGAMQERIYQRHLRARQHDDADIALLAKADRAHERLNRSATRRILEGDRLSFGMQQCRRMAAIPVPGPARTGILEAVARGPAA
jgi:hypothetical protein